MAISFVAYTMSIFSLPHGKIREKVNEPQAVCRSFRSVDHTDFAFYSFCDAIELFSFLSKYVRAVRFCYRAIHMHSLKCK